MTVFWVFQSEPTHSGEAMEWAPNLAVPERILKSRSAEQRSRTYHDGPARHPNVQPEERFPNASMSSRLVVWRRTSGQVPPRGEQPDEVWSLTPRGAVVRTALSGARQRGR
ncbi:hypothetical protein ACFY2H_30415 [Streptomyces griseofuscus]|uniref:hypothetical protein n=1 Tax=Streptomycetaceae TaxID=2062 RepID=UPI0005693A4F|nr:hypothetical protein [Actinacidiphila yeochonensis]